MRKILLFILPLLISGCGYRTVIELEPNKVTDIGGQFKKNATSSYVKYNGYLDFEDAKNDSETVGYYSEHAGQGYNLYKFESRLYPFSWIPFLSNKHKLNKNPQSLCIGSKKGEYEKYCNRQFTTKPKQAFGKWYVSKQFYIKNHGIYRVMVSDGMEWVQFRQYKDKLNYETMVAPLFEVRNYIKYGN